MSSCSLRLSICLINCSFCFESRCFARINVSPLPCSHPTRNNFCVPLEFHPEIVCKVEKVHSTFHTLHDYLNFFRGGKEDRLFTIYILGRKPWCKTFPFQNICNSLTGMAISIGITSFTHFLVLLWIF